jgi:hypothetical protein
MGRKAKGYSVWNEEDAVERLLTAVEAAALADVSLTSVKVAAATKRLPYFMVGNGGVAFRRDDVLAAFGGGRKGRKLFG